MNSFELNKIEYYIDNPTDGNPFVGIRIINGKYHLSFPIGFTIEEKDENSILNYYRKLVKLRKEYKIISDGDIKFIETENEKVIAYKRIFKDKILTVICNFSPENQDIKNIFVEGKILISNYDNVSEVLRPYEAVAILK